MIAWHEQVWPDRLTRGLNRLRLRSSGAVLVLVLAGIGLAVTWLPLPLAAVAVLGSMGGLLLLLHPEWGLMVLILLIPFSPLVSMRAGGVRVGGMEALLAVMLVAWLLRMSVRHRIIVPQPPLLLPWLIWLAVLLFSWLTALSLGASIAETLKWVEMLALFLFMAALVQRRHIPWLVGAMLLAGAGQAAVGLYQFVFQVGPEGFLIFGGGFLRASGTFQQPNPFAGYMGLVLPVAYSLVLWGLSPKSGTRLGAEPDAGSQTDRKWLRQSTVENVLLPVVAAVAFVLMLGGLYASQSRGAWIGAAAALVVVSVVRSKRAALLFAVLLVLLAVFGALGAFQLIPAPIVQRFTDVLPVAGIPNIATAEVTDANFPAIERLAHWQAALDMWRDHLWRGVGFGNYEAVYPAYAVGRWLDPLGHAHNYYLNVAAETGLPGILAFGLFWISALVLSWRAIRRSRGFLQAVAAGCLGVLVHLSLHNGVDNLFVQGMYLHLGIILGLVAFIYRFPAGKENL